MDFTGRYVIPAPPETVWAASERSRRPQGLHPRLREDREDRVRPNFVATATLKIGPVKATFQGKVGLSDLDPPHRCRLTGEGQGGVAGFAKGECGGAF